MMVAPQKRKRHPIDVPKLRKNLIWMLPLSLGCIWLCWFITEIYVVNTVKDIRSNAPVVEILGMVLTAPPGALFSLFILLLAPARAFYFDTFGDWIEDNFSLPITVLLGGTMLIAAVLSYPLQSYFMPRLGYTRCGILYGHTSLVSPSRWLKYPELCIRDKGVDWVKAESARIERESGQPVPLPKETR